MNYKSRQGLTCILFFMENGNTKSSASPFPGDWWTIKKSIGASMYMGLNLVSEAKSDEYCYLNMCADRRVVQPPSIVSIIRWHPRLHPRLEKPCKSKFKCAASKFTDGLQVQLKWCLLTTSKKVENSDWHGIHTFIVAVSRTTGRSRAKYGTLYNPTKDAIIK